MYEEVARAAQSDPEALRWASYAFENPEDAHDPFGDELEFESDTSPEWEEIASNRKVDLGGLGRAGAAAIVKGAMNE